jgi:alpha-mannosidase
MWQLRSGYSRLGQRLYHPAAKSQVCRRWSVTAQGPAFAEIQSEGELLGADGKSVLVKFTQRTRIWVGRPHVEIRLHVEPLVPLSGDPEENYVACRWAWPEEKAMILPANGYLLQASRSADFEAPQLIEMRERKLFTDLFTHGLPFHKRVGYRMMDTLLLVEGETRRDFMLSVGLDLAQPWSAVHDNLWPAVVRQVTHGPPKLGRSGWLAKVDSSSILCTRMTPVEHDRAGVQLRLLETNGTSTRAQLQFARDAQSGRLTNHRGQLIFDLYAADNGLAVDFSPHETLQVEAFF